MSSFSALDNASLKTAESPRGPNDVADTSASADEWLRSSATHGSRASPELVSQKGWRDQGRPACQSSNYPHGDGGHTRKFSVSVEVQREQQVQERTPDAATVPTTAEFRESYGTLKRAHHFYDNEQRDNELSWRVDQALYEPQHISSTSTQDYMEKQIGDALRRLTGQMGHRDDSQTSPDVKDGSIAAYGRPYGPEHKQDSILHHDSKERQRNLSSLARTGCLTCRKRKKKCDEHKPKCEPARPQSQQGGPRLTIP